MVAAGALMAAVTTVAQESGAAERVAAVKQSLQAGMAAIRKYEWVETTTVSLKGEQKSSKQNRCYYGADGALQKVPTEGGQAGAQKSPRGIRGKIVANKKEEMTDYMDDAVALIKEYVPPDPARIQAVKDAGKVSINLLAADRHQLQLRDYHKAGDVLSIYIDPTTNHLLGLNVSTYLEKPDDLVTLDVTMTTLGDGAIYPSEIMLNGVSKSIKVDIRNTGHRPMGPQG